MKYNLKKTYLNIFLIEYHLSQYGIFKINLNEHFFFWELKKLFKRKKKGFLIILRNQAQFKSAKKSLIFCKKKKSRL